MNVGRVDLANGREVAMQQWHSVRPSIQHCLSDSSGPSRSGSLFRAP
jgi:hypothetical protein